MIVSSLASAIIPAHPNNYYGDRKGAAVDRIIVHHMAAVWTAKRCGESFQNPQRGASSNYGIGNGGEIACYVPEDLCSGASNSYEADRHAVTVEVSNCETGGDWRVGDAALKALVKLCADIAGRYGFSRLVKGENLCWHSMYAATACPGPYLLSKMDYICDEVNKQLCKKTEDGYYTGFNVKRTADALCVYISPLAAAPTNKYGWEVSCDKNGIALCDAVYGKGLMAVPEGGRVYSGNGKGGQFVKNIRKGYKVWIQDGRVQYNTRQHRSVDGEDCSRGKDMLIVYRKNTVKRNIWGCEVAVDKDGIVQNTPVYGKCNLDVPSGGCVISGHGAAAKWLLKYARKGGKINLDGKVITIE